MASKGVTSTAFLLCLNLLFFTVVSSTNVPSSKPSCPMNALKLGVCAKVLNLVNVKIGSPPTEPCCSLIEDLIDLEAAACLCTAIKAKVLDVINLDVPVALSIILNNCGKKNSGFQCA